MPGKWACVLNANSGIVSNHNAAEQRTTTIAFRDGGSEGGGSVYKYKAETPKGGIVLRSPSKRNNRQAPTGEAKCISKLYLNYILTISNLHI